MPLRHDAMTVRRVTTVLRWPHHNRWRRFWLVVSAIDARHNKKSAEALSLLGLSANLSDHMNCFFDRIENFVNLVFADDQRWRKRQAVAGVAN